MNKTITCINCPIGCRISVELSENGEVLSVAGNTCPRGEKYAVQECTQPTRVITAVIPVQGSSMPLSLKTNVPVPKTKIQDIMKIIGQVSVSPPVSIGDVIIQNILDTGADVVATRSVPE